MRCAKQSGKQSKRRTLPVITQAHLREYLAVKHRADVAYRRLSRLDGELIRLLRADTPVESGNLTARAQGHFHVPVTEEDVKAYFGAENYENMKLHLTPATYHELIVAEEESEIEE